ncbi:universal stress protein in QAH/OAS sulfhydrylase 3'region-like [Mercenaria mercenaria]|uniref:universal stress protein in QAH/OAS sulfhydrylase 3'region-like n=1 Tax=Mercenaria mercenaria TaxID=6596 RepID=UPI00234F7543|nr:universal stress protein in QAH/OAS sulfhydrylase 3'region-like [Mercenaria mercenaria]
MTDKMEKEMRVLIAMDGSKYCDYAFDWYLENLNKPNTFVILMHCADLNNPVVRPGDIGSPGLLKFIEEERATCDKYVHELTERMKATNLHGKVKRTHGPPRSEILRVAEEEKVDMIITGSRGKGAVRRTLLGSVSDHVLHHAHVPVIICKHKDDTHHHTTHESKK